MSMTDQEHKALRSYCAFILKEYGFQLSPNDPVIPALYIIHKEMQLNNQNNKAIANLIKESTAKMKSRSYTFNGPGEAWKFQMAGALKWFVAGLMALGLATLFLWYWSITKDVERAHDIIQGSSKTSELLKRVSKDNEGYYFVDFKEAPGTFIQSFIEFERIDKKTVRVYLGKAN